MTKIPVISIDGPAGSGKGTITHHVASRLRWHMLDSGALYRLVAFDALQTNVNLNNETALAELARQLDVKFIADTNDSTKVLLRGHQVTHDIRTEGCGGAASQIAAYPLVRTALLQRQRDFLRSPGLVADGRDMGTVVFPDALVKVFLTASAQIRAKRRQNQLKEQGISANLGCLIRDIEERDARDCARKDSPLKPAEDAYLVDTNELSIEEVVNQVLRKAARYLA